MADSLAYRIQPEARTAADGSLVWKLRSLAIRALTRMYRPDEKLFVFRVRWSQNRTIAEGLSRRYTAIALIGLAEEGETVSSPVLAGDRPQDVCKRLMGDVANTDNLGDAALTLWAARAVGYPNRRPAWERLLEFRPANGTYPVVELAWTLAALCIDEEMPAGDLRERLAYRLISSFVPQSGMFPHIAGGKATGLRSHLSCFADLVYPVHALAHFARLSGSREALDVALRCARRFCSRQGQAGQWWWHYHLQTGEVIEPYPVYAVHQDAMAPMALFTLEEASGEDFTPHVSRGLSWMAQAPELGGGSLIDDDADVIWRKVARREPRKLVRYLQTITSRIHPSLRAPGVDVLFPVGAVDYEDRPYHLGWLLYAWPSERVVRWQSGERTLCGKR